MRERLSNLMTLIGESCPLSGFVYGASVILAVLLVLLAVIHHWFPWLNRAWRIYRNKAGSLSVILVISILCLGLFGKQSDTEPSRLIHAISLLKLDTMSGDLTPAEHIARSLATLLWVVIGIEINRRLLFTSLRALGLVGIRNHAVICGLGEAGMKMVRDVVNAHQRAVVIEIDEDNPFIDDAEELGAIIIHGNAQDDEVLKSARIETASKFFALTGGDPANAALLAHVRTLTQATRQAPQKQHWLSQWMRRLLPIAPLRCYAAIDDVRLADAMRGVEQKPPHLSVTFSVPELLGAREMLRHQFLEDLPSDLGNRAPHFVIVGFKKQGQAMARMIADLVHLENEKRCRVTILHDDESDREQFLSQFPAFCQDVNSVTDAWNLPTAADDWADRSHQAMPHLRFPESEPGLSFVCNAGFEKLGKNGVGDDLVVKLRGLLSRDDCLPFVVLCQDDDAENLHASQHLVAQLQGCVDLNHDHPWSVENRQGNVGMPIYVQIWGYGELGTAIENHSPSDGKAFPSVCRCRPFASAKNVLGYEAIASDDVMRLAYRIFAAYKIMYSKSVRDSDRMDLRWEKYVELDPSYGQDSADKMVTWSDWSAEAYPLRYSNVAAALHGAFKLRVLDRQFLVADLRGGTGCNTQVEIDRDLFRKLGRIEHNRWNSEKLMRGWRYATRKPGELPALRDARRERHQLVACSDMPDILKDEFEVEFFKDLMQYECLLRHYGIPRSLSDDLKKHAEEIVAKRAAEAEKVKEGKRVVAPNSADEREADPSPAGTQINDST